MLRYLDLNGTWKVRWSDGTRGRPEFANQEVIDPDRYIDAQVPGEIHLEGRLDQLVPLAELSPDLKTGAVRVRQFVENFGKRSIRGKMTVEVAGTGVRKRVDVEIRGSSSWVAAVRLGCAVGRLNAMPEGG